MSSETIQSTYSYSNPLWAMCWRNGAHLQSTTLQLISILKKCFVLSSYFSRCYLKFRMLAGISIVHKKHHNSGVSIVYRTHHSFGVSIVCRRHHSSGLQERTPVLNCSSRLWTSCGTMIHDNHYFTQMKVQQWNFLLKMRITHYQVLHYLVDTLSSGFI